MAGGVWCTGGSGEAGLSSEAGGAGGEISTTSSCGEHPASCDRRSETTQSVMHIVTSIGFILLIYRLYLASKYSYGA